MRRQAVESSAIVSVGYEPDTRTLEIEFVGGSVYSYFDVPATEHAALMAAPSHGTYLNERIKPFYRYRRL